MAKVHLLASTDGSTKHDRLELEYMLDSVERDRFGVHTVVAPPEEADLILFVEREYAAGDQLERVREHPIYNRYRDKCFVVNPRYKGVPFVPGIYASIREPWYDRSRLRSGHYLEVRENDHFQYKGPVPDDGYLYSFRGKLGTAPVRQRMTDLSHPRGTIEDTTDQNITSMMDTKAEADTLHAYQQAYAELVSKSKFVLCPRGVGPSSLRLFETMLMGRVPVIISDQWVPPEGPDWNSATLRIPESQIHTIPQVLEKHEQRADELGRTARAIWEEWFSPQVSFHRLVEWCLDIQGTAVSALDMFRHYRSLASSLHAVRSAEALAVRVKHRCGPLLNCLSNASFR